MATLLALRNTTNNGIAGFFDVSPAAGSSTATGIVNSAASGTNIQWTATAGGAVLQWITGKSSAGWTLAGSVSVKLWALENNALANCGGRLRLFKRSTGGVETEIAGGPWDDGVEFTTSNVAYTWSFTPTSTAFAVGERLIVRFYITGVGGMATGRTCTMAYGNTAAASADSGVTLTENVTFNEARSGALDVTLGPATLAASGLVIPVYTSAFASEAFASGAFYAGVVATGTLSATLGAVTLAATGTVANQVFSGTLGVTLGALTGTITGKVTVSGTAAGTLLPMMLVGTGTVANQVFSGSLNVTLDALTLSATGAVISSFSYGTLNVTLDALTLEAIGTVSVPSVGVFAATLGALTLTATGTVGDLWTPLGDRTATWIVLPGDAFALEAFAREAFNVPEPAYRPAWAAVSGQTTNWVRLDGDAFFDDAFTDDAFNTGQAA